MSGKIFTVVAAAVLGLTASMSACAVDTGTVEFGSGNRTQMLRVGLESQWENHWFDSNGTYWGGYWLYDLSEWRGNRYQNVVDQTQTLTDIGVTPVFRFQRSGGVGPYFEAAIGAHWQSQVYNNNGRRQSTNFQFGDHIGVGYQGNEWGASLKFQHFSNGGIKHPNYGVNLVVAGISKKF